ncbi:AI-2E family transporter [Candidatus Peregrinibacteria bacterium]|jgi:sporulation integral membrane protein YtvI|nr:AI-2E family transporter [Candidatus Peregrinibacteria bacterium]MBT4631871.1 AI-2E family transporter [Candidatus Peregrinibacteria bacterium]MBT5516811.1 AI-2E family transporter [Candidatus Peregrinibacteria bacterium]MBT5824208.1 AI-2E family transporter [Candidatus Peregrinibacteria bacterium]
MKQFDKFFKSSRKKMKKLREKIRKLKEEQDKEEQKLQTIKKPKVEKKDEVVVHISALSAAKATIVVLALVILANFLGDITDIILVFFVSILFAAALDPTVDSLEKYKIPRALSVIGIFIIIIGLIVFFISQLVPLVASQIIELAKNLNTIVVDLSNGESALPFADKLEPLMQNFLTEVDQEQIVDQLKNSLETLGSQLEGIAGNTLGTIKNLFNGIINFLLVLVLTFFIVVDERGVDDFFISLFPSKHGKYIVEKMEAVKHKVGFWLRGQVILMIVMFVITWIGFMIIGVDYALTLAMLAGIAEIIPIVGPIIAGVPAGLVAFNESYWLVLWVIGFILVVQQIEANVIVPLVMKKAVGLSPIIIILSMMIGFKSIGVLGAIIAIPVATTLSIFVKDYAAKKK